MTEKKTGLRNPNFMNRHIATSPKRPTEDGLIKERPQLTEIEMEIGDLLCEMPRTAAGRFKRRQIAEQFHLTPNELASTLATLQMKLGIDDISQIETGMADYYRYG